MPRCTVSDPMVLVCKICRWRPPNDLVMSLVESHFDLEPDHDPENLVMELVAMCDRDQTEMTLDRSEELRSGKNRYYYSCPTCKRSATVDQSQEGGGW